MKNQIYAGKQDDGNKWAAFLYRYHEKPSGSVIPILMVSTKFAFNSAKEATDFVFNNLKPESQQYTEIYLSDKNKPNLCQ